MNIQLINIGMTTLIRLCLILCLVSCSVIPEFKSFGNNSANSLQSLVNKSSKYKYNVIIKESRFNYSLFTKTNYEDDLWSNDSYIAFKICDFRICFYKENSNEYISNFNIPIEKLLNNDKEFYKNYIQFTNPNSGFISQISKFNLIEEGKIKGIFSDKEYSYFLLEEEFSVPKIKWTGKNLYYLDNSNYEVIKISQSISPFKKNIILFYK